MYKTRLQGRKAADVAAAGNLKIGNGIKQVVTGNTQIDGIYVLNWFDGAEVDLYFTGTPRVKDSGSPGAGYAALKLAGGVDFVAAAGDQLTVWYDGAYWQEKGRKLA